MEPSAPEPCWPAAPELRRLVLDLPPPIIICNKSHSGSRLLTNIVKTSGAFMGSHLNESEDALDMVPAVRYLVIRHYPEYARAVAGGDPLLDDVLTAALTRHLADYDRECAHRWGWKLCETSFVLPVVARLFPDLRVVHLIRDGRDVAFSDHVGPVDDFWKKIFFGRSDLDRWSGMALTGPLYRRHAPIFNAQHWLSSVVTARRYGKLLGSRYLELRYEDMCRRFDETSERLLRFLGLTADGASLAALRSAVSEASIGKFRRHPRRVRHAVVALIGPIQIELGYPATIE
jgi:hypothetical protein